MPEVNTVVNDDTLDEIPPSGPSTAAIAAEAFLPNDLKRFSARITFVSTFFELLES